MGDIIRKSRNGKDYGWYIRWTEQGKRREKASHQPTYVLAKRMLLEIEARVARGMAGIIEPDPASQITVQELCAKFLSEYSSPEIKDLAQLRAQDANVLRRVYPHIGHVSATELDPRDVARTRDALSKKYAPGSVRGTLKRLGRVFAWAMKEGILEKNPVTAVKRPPSPAPRLDYLTADEVRSLLEVAQRYARAPSSKTNQLRHFSRFMAISLAVRLGLRKGEIFGLRWQDIDIASQRLTVARSYKTTPKNGKPRHLRLPTSLISLLREWRELCPHTPAKLVCPTWQRLSQQWEMPVSTGYEHQLPELLREGGCRVLSRPWHTLRHTFASHFTMAGGSLLALAQILGHSDVKMTMIYAHLSPTYLADELDKLKF